MLTLSTMEKLRFAAVPHWGRNTPNP